MRRAATARINRTHLCEAVVALGIVEWILSPLWHEPLLWIIRAVQQFWNGTAVVCAPLFLWAELLDALNLTVKGTQSVIGGLLGILVVVPLLVIGGLALELIWILPYLVVQVAIAAANIAMTVHLLVPLITATIAWRSSPQLRRWIRPSLRAVAIVLTPVTQQPSRLCTIGPANAELYARVDPFTRTRFTLGEPFVLCGGGCGRAYKLVTCRFLDYRCPVDSASLRVSTP
jgi:hypothetical protein